MGKSNVFAGFLVVSGISLMLFIPFVFAHSSSLEADLMGEEIMGVMPEGEANWRIESDGMKRMKVEVDDVNLADGTMLSVDACGIFNIGMIEINGMQGDIDLREKNGDMVPMCNVGDMVSVMNGTTTILSGELMEED